MRFVFVTNVTILSHPITTGRTVDRDYNLKSGTTCLGCMDKLWTNEYEPSRNVTIEFAFRKNGVG